MTTAVTITPTPILQFFNNQGLPCVGGTVLTTVGGINTTTYQDSAGNVPLPNPIPLNNRGEISNSAGVSSQCFLQTGIVYTFTLFDAQGNQLNQSSYMTTPNSVSSTALAAATGASLVGFSAAGTGALPRTMLDKGREWISDADYPTLPLAVAAAAGKTLRILGTWAVTAAMAVASNTTIVLDAAASITTATPDIHVFDASAATNVHIQGFGKIASTATTGTVIAGLVNLTGAVNSDVSGLELVGMQWAGVLMGTGSVNCWAYNCRIHDFLATVQDCAGVQIIDGALNCGVKGGYATNTGYHGINVQERGGSLVPKGTLIEGFKITTTKVYGINTYNKVAHGADQNTTIRDCDITDVMGGAPYNTSGGAGIYIQSAGNVKVFGGTISYCCWGTQDNSLTAAGIGIQMVDAAATPPTIEGVTFLNIGFTTAGVQNPNAVLLAAISVNSGLVSANIGPCVVRQLLANTAFTFIGYYINANSNVHIVNPTMDISTTATASRGIFMVANTLAISNITITGGRITGGDSAQISIDQIGGFRVSNVNISNIALTGGSANCENLKISQGSNINVTNVSANATTAASLDVSGSLLCKFTNCEFGSTGTITVTTSGTCTGSVFDETCSYGADSKMSNVATGFTVKSRGAATPTAGIWAVNDVRQLPVVSGQPVQTGCRVAGTPGTWTNSGNWT